MTDSTTATPATVREAFSALAPGVETAVVEGHSDVDTSGANDAPGANDGAGAGSADPSILRVVLGESRRLDLLGSPAGWLVVPPVADGGEPYTAPLGQPLTASADEVAHALVAAVRYAATTLPTGDLSEGVRVLVVGSSASSDAPVAFASPSGGAQPPAASPQQPETRPQQPAAWAQQPGAWPQQRSTPYGASAFGGAASASAPGSTSYNPSPYGPGGATAAPYLTAGYAPAPVPRRRLSPVQSTLVIVAIVVAALLILGGAGFGLVVGVSALSSKGASSGSWEPLNGSDGSDAGDSGDGDDGATGTTPATSLKEGDCFDLADAYDLTDDILPKSCTSSHDSEAFAVITLPDTVESVSDRTLYDAADAACFSHFKTYVGDSADDSEFDYDSFAPSHDEWDSGQHTAICYVALDDNRSSSVKGSGE
ncbi:septum formation family protein [Frondihabitans cladoniiphilus]|uniref:Septum formation-related domain-containing protein n=1 Tax=Frondihabitans cladoniiphilus TaxID=715785 RepID=A0ABP8VKC4_9MICO